MFDNFNAQVVVEGQSISLSLWDTAGQEEYDRLRLLRYPYVIPFYLPTIYLELLIVCMYICILHLAIFFSSYPETDVMIICFNTVSNTSLVNVKARWMPEIKEHVKNKPIMLGKIKKNRLYQKLHYFTAGSKAKL